MSGDSSGPARNAAIVFSLDDRFISPALVTMESIRRCGGELCGVTLVILTTDLCSSSIAALEEGAQRLGLPISIRRTVDVAELGAIEKWAIPTCLRLFTGDAAADFDRALYLDSDVLVLSELAPLLDVDLKGRSVAAVINYPPIEVMRVAIRRSNRGAADPDAPYFNAAVMLIDTERWMRLSIGRDSRLFLNRYPATRLLDQDALNMVLVNDWQALDRAWNAPAGQLDAMPMFAGLAQMNRSLVAAVREWEEAQQKPKILHFTGKPKPWDADYPWPELRQRYFEFVRTDAVLCWPEDRAQTSEQVSGDVRIREFQRSRAR